MSETNYSIPIAKKDFVKLLKLKESNKNNGSGSELDIGQEEMLIFSSKIEEIERIDFLRIVKRQLTQLNEKVF